MQKLNKVLSVLKSGGVVIVPTDTVYGFIADVTDKKAVANIYKIKNRPKDKPLPVFVSGLKMAKEFAVVDSRAEKLMKKRWPGAYTFVVNRKPGQKLYGVEKATIAMRVPKNTFIRQLVAKLGHPVVQTSANISGQAPLKTREAIYSTFAKNRSVGLILTSKKLLKGKASKIMDLTAEKVVRLR